MSGKYLLRELDMGETTTLSMLDIPKGEKKSLLKFEGKIDQIKWTSSDEYFAVKIKDSLNLNNNALYVFNTENFSKITEIKKDIREFYIEACLLFYTLIEDRQSKIIIYDMISNSIYLQLDLVGGSCINGLGFYL